MERYFEHPDIRRAAAIISGVTDEANKLIRGDGKEVEGRRNALKSVLIDDVTRRNGLNIRKGKSSANSQASRQTETGLQSS